MNRRLSTVLIILLLLLPALASPQSAESPGGLEIIFENTTDSLSAAEQGRITSLIRQAEAEVRTLLPELPDRIRVSVGTLDRDLTSVGGVTGRADDPVTVVIYISTASEPGVSAAIETGLKPVLYHEFHHLARGWTIRGNSFPSGIPIAAVNEGLANVFSEIYTNTAFAGNAYPVDAASWWEEIRDLPVNANYGNWMVEHPDGRQAIGYKAGSYIIRELMANSQYSILDLSALSMEQLFSLIEDQQGY